ncbi:ImmA/IrrE family metallo-endopeptidase [Paenibacillus sp. FSL R5-0636]|uniref:ImmA/IrrE family metallo-endopeptidase n=1 Tax=Paenibacillus TaxID=44249 RepID=UPI00096C7171|nr:ImmA/IrrE family metallo-endopeptidase [Paenibacillus odorifer]OMD05721.1 hypothetical protein BJP49_19290 [Paenibacillus odorifer]
MNFYQYFKTPLEQWIEDRYQENGIFRPSDLTIEKVSRIFNTEVIYYEHTSFSDNEERIIFLNKYEEENLLRKFFFHELCHVVRHSGDQRWMPSLFRDAQENEADFFSLYTSIPFYIFQSLPLPNNKNEAIGFIAHEFKMPLEIAKKRFQQIEERIAQSDMLSALGAIAAASSKQEDTHSKAADFHFRRDTQTQPRIRAYYSWDGDFSRPHALVIEHPIEFDWNGSLDIQINRDYKTCDKPSGRMKDIASIIPSDLSISKDKGSITINLSRVAWRHGNDIEQLYLPLDVIDDALNF